MAVVKGPALSIDASGNVCGICFTKWRGLQIARCAWSGGTTPTGLQTAQKNRMVSAVRAWSNTLTAGERASWRAAAADQIRISRVKTTYIPSGFHYFIGLTVQLMRQGFQIRRKPPVAGISYGFGSLRVRYDLVFERMEAKPLDHFILERPGYRGDYWRAGPFDGGGRNPIAPDWRFLEFASLESGIWDNTVDLDKFYWYRARWIHETGRVGNWFQGQAFSG